MVLADSHGISRVPRYSGTYPASQITVVYRAVTVYGGPFQTLRLVNWFFTRRPCGLTGPTTPPCMHDGLGCSAFARRYFRNRYCFLFLQVLRWFTSLGLLRRPMYSVGDTPSSSVWVSPFGNLRIKACLRLPEAYRSLPRPSSPAGAKASTVRP